MTLIAVKMTKCLAFGDCREPDQHHITLLFYFLCDVDSKPSLMGGGRGGGVAEAEESEMEFFCLPPQPWGTRSLFRLASLAVTSPELSSFLPPFFLLFLFVLAYLSLHLRFYTSIGPDALPRLLSGDNYRYRSLSPRLRLFCPNEIS